MTPSKTALGTILRHCGIVLPADQLEKLWEYHGILRAANAELNLTRIHNFENMVLKHYVDSLLILKFIELPSPLVDMGSGPGLPGIPLKIVRPEISMILAEPRGARAEFLQEVVNRLNLPNCEVYAGKVGARFPRQVKGVITRAVATIPETLERVAACLEPGGQMIFMKGPECSDEVEEASRTQGDYFKFVADHAYSIPGTTHDRRLVIYERLDSPAPNAPVVPLGPVREVTSEANPTFKLARDLLTGRGIRKQGQALISGSRIVTEVLDRYRDQVEAWVTNSTGPAPPVEAGALTWLRLSDPLFAELDVSGTKSPLLMVRTPEMPTWDPTDWPEGCTLFVPFQDPENVGAVIRSAAALGAAQVVLLREAAHPFHPKAARAAGPALFQIPLRQGPSIRDLASADVPLLALDADGEDLTKASFPDRFGLVVGVEGPGLPETLRTGRRLRIPIDSRVESLNAATSAAIALYEMSRGRVPLTSPSSPPEPDV